MLVVFSDDEEPTTTKKGLQCPLTLWGVKVEYTTEPMQGTLGLLAHLRRLLSLCTHQLRSLFFISTLTATIRPHPLLPSPQMYNCALVGDVRPRLRCLNHFH